MNFEFFFEFWIFFSQLQLIISILKTEKVYEKNKLRLHLHDIGFQGFLCLMQGQSLNLEIIHLLTDIILFRDHPNCYSGILASAYALAEENLEIKLEFSKRLLALILSRPNAATAITKQVFHFRAVSEQFQSSFSNWWAPKTFFLVQIRQHLLMIQF